jgi:hypothetical protein
MITWKLIRKEIYRIAGSLLGHRRVAVTGWADGSVVSETRPNYIRIVLDEVEVEAWNDNVPQISGLEVDVYVDPDFPGVLFAKRPRLIFSKDFPFVTNKFHRLNHMWPNVDFVPIELRQFLPLHPSVNGFVLTVRSGWIETSNGLKFFTTKSKDLKVYRPLNGAHYVVVSINDDCELVVTQGVVKTKQSLSLLDIPEASVGTKRVCSVRLFIGQTEISDKRDNPDLIDHRFYLSSGNMETRIYDQDVDGVVDFSSKVLGVDTTGLNKYYGTNGQGVPGFHHLPPSGGEISFSETLTTDETTPAPRSTTSSQSWFTGMVNILRPIKLHRVSWYTRIAETYVFELLLRDGVTVLSASEPVNSPADTISQFVLTEPYPIFKPGIYLFKLTPSAPVLWRDSSSQGSSMFKSAWILEFGFYSGATGYYPPLGLSFYDMV